jgi:hypothetical protein
MPPLMRSAIRPASISRQGKLMTWKALMYFFPA